MLDNVAMSLIMGEQVSRLLLLGGYLAMFDNIHVIDHGRATFKTSYCTEAILYCPQAVTFKALEHYL